MAAPQITTIEGWHAENDYRTVISQLSPGQEPSLLKLLVSESHSIDFHTAPKGRDTEEEPLTDRAEDSCEIHCIDLLTSRKEIAAGSSCSRYECVLAQRRARMRTLLLLLSVYSNLSCSEPGGDAAW